MMRFLILLIFGAMPLMADFAEPEQNVPLEYGQKEVVVVFEADMPIKSAKPLCTCTTVRREGKRLVATVDTSEFTHSVDKQIDATTSDGVTTRLTMHLRVPQAVELSARSLTWKKGEKAEPKVITITLPAGSPVREVKEAGIVGDDFDYTPHTVKPGAEYTVSVVPRSMEKKVFNRLVIKTDNPDPRYAQFIIYLSVKP